MRIYKRVQGQQIFILFSNKNAPVRPQTKKNVNIFAFFVSRSRKNTIRRIYQIEQNSMFKQFNSALRMRLQYIGIYAFL